MVVIEDIPRILPHLGIALRRQIASWPMSNAMNLTSFKHGLRIAKDEVNMPFDIAVRIVLPPRHALLTFLHASHARRIQRVLRPQQPHMPQDSSVRTYRQRHRLRWHIASLAVVVRNRHHAGKKIASGYK